MKWGEKRNICPTCVKEFTRFTYKNANGKTVMMKLVSPPKMDQEPQQHRTPKWIIGFAIYCILSIIPLLVLLESHLNFLHESNRNLIIIVTAAIVVFCGVRVRVHHDVHQLAIEIWYDLRHLFNVTWFLSSILLILICFSKLTLIIPIIMSILTLMAKCFT